MGGSPVPRTSPACQTAPKRWDGVPGVAKARSAGIDVLRIVGVVAVVAGHVQSGNGVLHSMIFSWHVPLFFVLSGYLFSRDRTIAEELSHRLRSLAVPYVSWFAIIMLLLVGVQLHAGSLTLESDLETLYGGAHAPKPFTT